MKRLAGRIAVGSPVEATDLKTNLKSTLFTVDAMFKYRGFSTTGMFAWGEVEPQVTNPSYDRQGWFIQAGYFLKPDRWEIAARYGENNPNKDVSDNKISEVRGGINWFYAKHAFKVQADFGQIKTETSSGERKNNELRIQTQFIF